MQRFGYRGDGAYGQFLVVLPDHDTVVAITAEQCRMQSTLDGLWAHARARSRRRAGSERRPTAELAERLAALEIPAMCG